MRHKVRQALGPYPNPATLSPTEGLEDSPPRSHIWAGVCSTPRNARCQWRMPLPLKTAGCPSSIRARQTLLHLAPKQRGVSCFEWQTTGVIPGFGVSLCFGFRADAVAMSRKVHKPKTLLDPMIHFLEQIFRTKSQQPLRTSVTVASIFAFMLMESAASNA